MIRPRLLTRPARPRSPSLLPAPVHRPPLRHQASRPPSPRPLPVPNLFLPEKASPHYSSVTVSSIPSQPNFLSTQRAGFLGHTQELVGAGGGGGAPEGLWNDPAKGSEIITHLSRGDVALFGMTYHPDYPTLTGYRLWVQEALSHNPQTAFFVGMPWVREPESRTASDYALTSSRAYETLMTPIIDQLKTEFPGSTFFAIPYGQAASDLYEVFEAGQLPGIRNVVGDSATSLFIDTLGHAAGTIVEELAVLVWLRAIYCVDLASYSYPSKFTVDLAAIAMNIVSEQRAEDAASWCNARLGT